MELKTYKDEKNGHVIRVLDLLDAFIGWNCDDNIRREFIESVVAMEDFAQAFKDVMEGLSDKEYTEYGGKEGRTYPADTLRRVVAESADLAARELIKHLADKVLELKQALSDSQEHAKKILEDWPEAYKKYVPKAASTWVSKTVDTRMVDKMLTLGWEAK